MHDIYMDYGNVLSKKAQALKPSGIRRFFDMLDEMKDVTSLTVGQPDFDTPWHIRDAAIESLKAGKTYYTSNSGLIELRRELSAYLNRRFGLSYDPKSEILVTVGGSEAIDLAFRAVLDLGDEVITIDPAFVCYDPLVIMAGGVPVPVGTRIEDNFKLTAASLRAAITPRTKMIILPFPNNPTGAVMDREDLEAIADVVRDTNILVLSDEIYAELTYGGKHTSFATLPGMRERTITVSGLSKAYAMTGWRIGYVCAPAAITYEMTKIHQFGIMCASTTSQIAAIDAFRNGDEDIQFMVEEYDGRRRLILNGLHKIGIKCFEPRGAFYVFPDLRPFGMSSDTFCERLLYGQRVAIVPGNAFGQCGEGFARISYAYSVMHIQKALHAIEEFVNKL
jgi:aminotransferase